MTTKTSITKHIDAYLAIEREMAQLRDRQAEHKAALLRAMRLKETDVLCVNGYKISNKEVVSKRCSMEKLKIEFPGAYTACLKESVTTRFLINVDKG